MDYFQEALKLHRERRGKLEIKSKVEVKTKDDLSLAYTPGVAQPCLEIQKDVDKSYELTRRWNMCLVATDGSAVLGLGDIGPEAGMPVMEGKCVLFKSFADVDAFPLCVKTHDVDEFVQTGEGSYEADGNMRIYDFFEELDIDDRDFDDDNATLGGWAIEMLGDYPKVGDSFDYKNLTITVKKLQNLRVTRLAVQVRPLPPEEEEE